MTIPDHAFLIGGKWRSNADLDEVIFPYTGEIIAQVSQASESDMEDATVSAERAFSITRRLPAHQREAILRKLADLMTQHQARLIDAMIMEGGKTRGVARGEHARAVQTVLAAAEEAKRIGGELVPMDWTPAGEGRFGLWKRFPLGPVLAITPFNYPLNLGCHKLAPAIAAGNPIVLKPAEDTPLSTLILAELVLEAGYPAEAISVVTAHGERIDRMSRDERFKFLTFTGSSKVGWYLKSIAGRKPVALELGGNAGIIVHSDARLDYAADRCVMGGFTNSGQNCISVQRIIVHESIFDEFADRISSRVAALQVGDPRLDSTDVGPMIRMADAERAHSWIQEAQRAGARILTGGERDGIMLQPTVLTNLQPDMRVYCQEVFAPVVSLVPYRDFSEAIRIANETDYGLQGGVFTQDINRMMYAFEEMEVGGLQINDVSTFRVDHMPYGGVKSSGSGREGVRYTVEHMTEMKLMVINMAGGTGEWPEI